MKKLLLMLFTAGIVFSASAQIHGIPRPVRVIAPRVTIVGGYAPYLGLGLGYGYNPYFGYNPFYGPYLYRSSRPTKLDLQIEDIKNDYKERIWSAKHDENMSRKERRRQVHELKHERDTAIIDARRNYHKSDYKS